MKAATLKIFLMLGVSGLLLSALAQEPQINPSVQVQATAKVPYGVADVVKLSHAQISDDIIVSYIQSLGTVYNLEPNDLVYLREQGVSDRVVNAMLEQRRHVTETAAATQQSTPAPVTTATYQTDQQQTSGPVTAPLTPAASYSGGSSVYVIPYAPTSYASYYPYYSYPYYGYPYYRYPYYCGYPYYGGYYRGWYGGPVARFGFGFGGHGHGIVAHGGGGHSGHGAHGGHH